MASKYILCVEDDPDACELLKVTLEAEGYKVLTASTPDKGLRLAQLAGFDLIILDSRYSRDTGADLCQRIRDFDPHTPIIFYSGAAYESDIAAGLAAGAQAYVVKPEFEKLVAAIAQLFGAPMTGSPSP